MFVKLLPALGTHGGVQVVRDAWLVASGGHRDRDRRWRRRRLVLKVDLDLVWTSRALAADLGTCQLELFVNGLCVVLGNQ